ncbi:hypothetical protein V7S57_19325 [Caulobacter sp. CCNWLY153]|uniref:hypothetical protein n=2 Tax=Caulobacteraceae TaxID=76892 RepID=UPI002FF4207A
MRSIAHLARRFERRLRAFHPLLNFWFGDAPSPVWNYMNTNTARAAAAQRKPRTQPHSRAVTPPARTEWAWPGLTRAELREHIIEQIG